MEKNMLQQRPTLPLLCSLIFAAVLLLAPVELQVGNGNSYFESGIRSPHPTAAVSIARAVDLAQIPTAEEARLAALQQPQSIDCGLIGNSSIEGCMAIVVNTMFKFFALLMGGAGVLLNIVVVETVIQMGANTENLGVIDSGWRVFRDFANIIIIFMFLAIGISTILGSTSFGIKRTLPKIIIVALLINFSLFFTQFFIDVSNLFATTAYNQFERCAAAQGTFRAAQDVNGSCVTFSDRFAYALSITTLYEVDPQVGTPNLIPNGESLLDVGNIITIGIMGSILFLVTTFTFLAATALLVIRYVVLIFLMVLSPLAFIGMVLPRTASYSRDWWEKLLHYSLFAPIYFLLTWFVLTIIEDPGFRAALFGSPRHFTGAALADVSSFSIFFNFVVVIGFMVASLIIANKMGIKGASTAISFGKDMQRWGQGMAGGAVLGGAGFAARQTAGRLSNRLAQSETLKSESAKSGFLGMRGALARGTLKTLRATGAASYDVRAAPVGKQISKELSLGKAGGKGGYTAQRKREVAERVKFGKSLGKNNMPVYAETLKKRTLLSSVTATTGSDRAASEKLTKEIKTRKDRRDLEIKEQTSRDKLRDLQTSLARGKSEMHRDDVARVEAEIESVRAEIAETRIKRDELRDEAADTKREEKSAGGKEKSGDEDK
ncbi:MAG TPA: hypothetical protein VGA06_02845 [Candidatus Paceibacterota bacterium]